MLSTLLEHLKRFAEQSDEMAIDRLLQPVIDATGIEPHAAARTCYVIALLGLAVVLWLAQQRDFFAVGFVAGYSTRLHLFVDAGSRWRNQGSRIKLAALMGLFYLYQTIVGRDVRVTAIVGATVLAGLATMYLAACRPPPPRTRSASFGGRVPDAA